MGSVKTRNFFREFLKVISLHSFYRPYVFIGVLVALFLIPLRFLESSPNLSLCYTVLGEFCYSVGITRGVSALLKGNIDLAINYNFLSFPVLIFMIVIIFYDLRKRIKD